MSGRPLLRLLRLQNTCITRQLELEEALYRVDPGNWLVLNDGPSSPVVVLGIGGKIDKLVNLEVQQRRQIPMFRRFTGGGTVVVDPSTMFVSFIGNSPDFNYGMGPRDLMKWSETFYNAVFATFIPPHQRRRRRQVTADADQFGLREHDYVFGHRKFAGNAQGLSRDRFVHHTSFLWDFDSRNMDVLTLPENQPDYRRNRDHDAFLVRMRDLVEPSTPREDFWTSVVSAAGAVFDVVEATVEEAEAIEASPKHTRKANRWETECRPR